MTWQDRFTADPGVCGGETVIKGTRVTLRTVLASLSEGARVEEILRDFPTLTEDDVRAVIAFAAAAALEAHCLGRVRRGSAADRMCASRV
jgi:uncharacterized protein (DUF433 family)